MTASRFQQYLTKLNNMSEKTSSTKRIKLGDQDICYEEERHNPETAFFQLERVHNDLDKLNEKENEEILGVEQKYVKLKQQCYNKRNEIIENLPDFWPNVFTSHPAICNLLYEEEEDCLHYLQKVEVEVPDNIKTGYTLKFYFRENPYFRNDVLVKEFKFKEASLYSISSDITWKKPISMKESVKKSPSQTFFGWFATNFYASNDLIAEVIKDDIWPNALQYYLVPDSDIEDNGKDEDSTDSSENELNLPTDKGQDNNNYKSKRLIQKVPWRILQGDGLWIALDISVQTVQTNNLERIISRINR